MSRQVFTAADIRRVHQTHPSGVLVLGPVDIVTPQAVDLAAELGLRLVRETPDDIRKTPDDIRAPRAASGELPPLRVVHGRLVTPEPFGEGLASPGTDVRLKDVITSTDGAPMAAGYMTLQRGEFPWTLDYAEIDVVLEGELVITRGSESVRAGPGDMIFIPKGSKITFGTPSNVRFAYITYPANWNA
ncbi:MAG TPA: cupin domain-containing protein [Anaerolineaceae bacterium]